MDSTKKFSLTDVSILYRWICARQKAFSQELSYIPTIPTQEATCQQMAVELFNYHVLVRWCGVCASCGGMFVFL